MNLDSPSLLVTRKARFWEETAYDRAFRGSFGKYMTDVEAQALDRVFPKDPIPCLLDLGCGHGRFLRWLAPRCRHVVGLDRSWRLLGIAEEGLKQDPIAVPSGLVFASATDLPFATDSLQAVTCVRVIQHVPNQPKALQETLRALQPGGCLVLVQYNWLSPHGLIRAFKLPVKALLRWILRLSGREPQFDEPTRWTAGPALKTQLAEAGFAVEQITGAWLFPLQYFRSRGSNNAWAPFLALARAYERLADIAPFKFLGGYLVVRCRKGN